MNRDIEYLYSLRKYIFAITAVFIISVVIGVFASIRDPESSLKYFEAFGESFGWIKDLDPLAIMMIIFLNNALKSLVALVLGIGLGIIPVVFISVNGIMLGMIADLVFREMGAAFVLAALLPHGIIEIPMILLSAGIGLRLGHIMYLSLKGERTDLKNELKQGIGFFMRRIVPLLLLAAVIETFITPLVISLSVLG
ncbi:MAG: stage II sporulation protein M [Candidatus Methanoperedenaceae archaeon]|nr:stage II sporulation protein M [Candidatus Methanoperedenaceae archaeon]